MDRNGKIKEMEAIAEQPSQDDEAIIADNEEESKEPTAYDDWLNAQVDRLRGK